MIYPWATKGAIVLAVTAVVGVGVLFEHLRKSKNGDVPTSGQTGEGSSKKDEDRQEGTDASVSSSDNDNPLNQRVEDVAKQAYTKGRTEGCFLLRYRGKNNAAEQPALPITVSL
jgi:hypothetical protein